MPTHRMATGLDRPRIRPLGVMRMVRETLVAGLARAARVERRLVREFFDLPNPPGLSRPLTPTQDVSPEPRRR